MRVEIRSAPVRATRDFDRVRIAALLPSTSLSSHKHALLSQFINVNVAHRLATSSFSQRNPPQRESDSLRV